MSNQGTEISAILLLMVVCLQWPQDAARGAASAEWSRDVRVLYEVTHFDFARIDGPPDKPWGVLRVIRGQASDGGVAAGGPLRAGPDLDLIEGVVVRATALKGSVPNDDSWLCLVPVPARSVFGTRPIYMVDQSPGMCICRLNVDPRGFNKTVLEDVHLIPDRWADKVAPALNMWRIRQARLADGTDAENRKQLTVLLKDDNPLLAFMAAKSLAAASVLSPDRIPESLLSARNDQGMIVDFLLLSHSSKDSTDRVVKALGAQIDAAQATRELHGIAAACALDLATASYHGSPSGRASYRLLEQIETRAPAISQDGTPDQYLVGALEELQTVRHRAQVFERMKHGGH